MCTLYIFKFDEKSRGYHSQKRFNVPINALRFLLIPGLVLVSLATLR